MADSDLYQTDILAWSERQAGALRELASRRDLPDALDLPHVQEEIEDLGQSELNAVKSFIRLILGHAIKCWADPDSPVIRRWHAEIGNWQNELVDRLTPGMRGRIDLAGLWQRAVRQATLARAETGSDRTKSLAALPNKLVLDDVLAAPATLVERLGASDATGAALGSRGSQDDAPEP